MKPLHECAFVKDGNKRVAYFVSEISITPNIDEVLSRPWRIIESSQFEQLVANNQVQFLVFDNNTIKCRYTQEELAALKHRFGGKFIIKTQDDYWNMDVSFKSRHIQAATSGKAIACSCASIEKVLGMHMIPIYMYGSVPFMINMIQELELEVGQPLNKIFKHNKENVASLALPSTYFDKLIDKLGNKYKLLFDTSAMKYILRNEIKTPKIPILYGKSDPEKMLKLLERLDRLTLKNEEALEVFGII